jgi:hypothetical protein
MGKQTVDRELVVRWIEALESGRYRQTRSCLRDAKGYCCLGVLCEVADPGRYREDGGYDDPAGGGLYYMLLPNDLAERVGLGNAGGLPDGTDWREGAIGFGSLAAANDAGVPFATIARWLRGYYGMPAEDAP